MIDKKTCIDLIEEKLVIKSFENQAIETEQDKSKRFYNTIKLMVIKQMGYDSLNEFDDYYDVDVVVKPDGIVDVTITQKTIELNFTIEKHDSEVD